MNLCVVKIPELPRRHHPRPIVSVRFNGQVQALAMYRDRAYCFDTDPKIYDAINDGSIVVELVSNGKGEVVEIDLRDNGYADPDPCGRDH